MLAFSFFFSPIGVYLGIVRLAIRGGVEVSDDVVALLLVALRRPSGQHKQQRDEGEQHGEGRMPPPRCGGRRLQGGDDLSAVDMVGNGR